jgi:flagellar L-ring protein precursor FlgH
MHAHSKPSLVGNARALFLTRFLALNATVLVMAATPVLAQGTRPTSTTQAPAATAATAATTASTVPTVAPRQSWTSDRRTFQVGDIITVLIDDYTITTAVKENVASDTRTRNLDLTAHLPTSTKGGGLDTRNDAQQQERGSAKRENRFQNEMSVRVIAVGANGLVQVKGTKNINVDKAMQDIVLTGWLRAQDISSQNIVESFRLADATIAYASPGALSKPKQGIVSKVLGAFWP